MPALRALSAATALCLLVGVPVGVATGHAADATPRAGTSRSVAPRPPQRAPQLAAYRHPVPATPTVLVPVRRVDLGADVGARGWAGEGATSSVISGGESISYPGAVDTTRAAAPADLYGTAREGSFSVRMEGLRPSTAYTLRLHLAEGYWYRAGQRVMDVASNSTVVAQGVDAVALAGGAHRAVTKDIAVRSAANGTLTVSFSGHVDRPSVAGLDLLWAQTRATHEIFVSGRPTRIAAVGDSITWGTYSEDSGGFRYPLWDALTAAGHAIEPVGPTTQPASGTSRWRGSGWIGWPGWRIDELLGPTTLNQTGGTIDSWLATYQPDVVLVHIGNNDNEQHEDQPRMARELGLLLDHVRQDRPNADVFVARIDNQGTPNGAISRYNETVSDLVVARAASDARMHLVDMEAVVEGNQFADGIHPTAEGYRRMANRWASAIEGQNG